MSIGSGNIKEIYVGTAKKMLGSKKRRDKEWITAETLAKIDIQKNVIEKVLKTKINPAPGKT